jgi:uncharacterized protein YdeI (YjbR/CyaY-like superfamily)
VKKRPKNTRVSPATATKVKRELPIRGFSGPDTWLRWLEANHARAAGLWLKIGKRASGIASVTYAEALEVALCFGWIDGLRVKHDAKYFRQRFTPRGARSLWSKINREKAEGLIAAGRMRPAGHRAIGAARADGRWDSAYESQRTATVPADLQAALDASPRARAFFATLDRVNRYAVLFRVQTAVRPETRARRIVTFVAMLAKKEKLHP